MIHKEINLNISGINLSVFMQDSFFSHHSLASPLHKHKYPEIHICASGCSNIFTDGKQITVRSGEMLIIPGDTYHRTKTEPGVERISFQISIPVKSERLVRLSPHQLGGIIEAIEHFNKTEDCRRLSGAFCCLLSEIVENPPERIHNITDRSFLIHEFFLYNYADPIKLTDLARVLNLSAKQTSRCVKAYLGTSFGEELTKRRMEAAMHLRETTDLPLYEIAAMVGYLSYSGFWKAFSLYQKHLIQPQS